MDAFAGSVPGRLVCAAHAGPRHAYRHRRGVLVTLLLGIGTAALFGRTCFCDFTNYDDPDYVTENVQVQTGLTRESVLWAFTTTHAANWHPLTWLSLQLDASCYGPRAWGFHLTNVLLHAAAVGVLFAALRRMTGAFWRSALAAALFACHPLHVESVAWVAERKDVLSGLFWALTLLAYAWHTRRPTSARYALVLTAFALGLMAKQMLVTLPCVLLLLDYWPLRRPAGWRLVWEKAPLFVLSVAACAATCYAQGQGAVRSWTEIPLGLRCANACVAYGAYLLKAVWPARLAVFYPFPSRIPAGEVTAAAAALAVVSALAVWQRRRAPYLIVGWLWFLGTLVPVIGLVQVGAQSMGDRYTYLPLIGLSLLAAWGLPDLVALCRLPRAATALLTAPALGACLVCSLNQMNHWQDSSALWRHCLRADPGNYIANNNLGSFLLSQGRLAEAEDCFRRAVREWDQRRPISSPYENLGNALWLEGNTSEAMAPYAAALRIGPASPMVHQRLGLCLLKEGRPAEAERHFVSALRLRPDLPELHACLGEALGNQGRGTEAIAEFLTAVRIDPRYAFGHVKAGLCLLTLGRPGEAEGHFRTALAIHPEWPELYVDLGAALYNQGRYEEAVGRFEEAVRVDPRYALGHCRLGVALQHQGNRQEAIRHYSEALRLDGGLTEARDGLAALTKQEGGR